MNHTQGLTTIGTTTMKLIVPLLETIAINNSFRYTKLFDDFHQGKTESIILTTLASHLHTS